MEWIWRGKEVWGELGGIEGGDILSEKRVCFQ